MSTPSSKKPSSQRGPSSSRGDEDEWVAVKEYEELRVQLQDRSRDLRLVQREHTALTAQLAASDEKCVTLQTTVTETLRDNYAEKQACVATVSKLGAELLTAHTGRAEALRLEKGENDARIALEQTVAQLHATGADVRTELEVASLKIFLGLRT